MRPAHRFTTLAATLIGALAMLALPAVAAAKDGNHDRIPDRWEAQHHLSTSVNQAGRDQDHDHLRNRAEFLAGDNPRNRDSDNDGVIDGNENAGTIASFDTASGKLTISLFGGETISGLVGEETEIKCEHQHSTASVSDQGGESSDDNQGEEEPGDDNGGQEEPGDDNNDHSGPGSPNSGPGSGDDDEGVTACTSADLVAGTVVQEAELKAANGTATFEQVELGS
jgi:hypothetical protein